MVYAEDKAPYFKSEVDGADGSTLATKMRADGAIPAAADVSFDVGIGEIFVIMGLSGSGKSTVVRELARLVGRERVAVLQHDAYYKNLADLPLAQRAMQNFDHPHALDNDLLIALLHLGV